MVAEILDKIIPKKWNDYLILLGFFFLVVAITIVTLPLTVTNNNALFMYGLSLILFGIAYNHEYAEVGASWVNQDGTTGSIEARKFKMFYVLIIIGFLFLIISFFYQFQIFKQAK
ncbi:MAG: hypothetical protein ACTSW1_01300 [Candidatus Hodarchaeales archaeon]